MNETIKELFVKSGGRVEGELTYTDEGFDPIRYAYLIVKECGQRIDYWESRQGEHCEDLLKHFGVTE